MSVGHLTVGYCSRCLLRWWGELDCFVTVTLISRVVGICQHIPSSICNISKFKRHVLVFYFPLYSSKICLFRSLNCKNWYSQKHLKKIFIETIFNLLRRKHLSFRHKWSTQLQAFTWSCSGQEREMTIFFFFHIFSSGLLWRVESSSVTRNGSQAPWMGSEES